MYAKSPNNPPIIHGNPLEATKTTTLGPSPARSLPGTWLRSALASKRSEAWAWGPRPGNNNGNSANHHETWGNHGNSTINLGKL